MKYLARSELLPGTAVSIHMPFSPIRWGIIKHVRGELVTVQPVLMTARDGDQPYTRLARALTRYHRSFIQALS